MCLERKAISSSEFYGLASTYWLGAGDGMWERRILQVEIEFEVLPSIQLPYRPSSLPNHNLINLPARIFLKVPEKFIKMDSYLLAL